MKSVASSAMWRRDRGAVPLLPGWSGRVTAIAAVALAAAGCELTEVTVELPEDVIVAEVQVVLTLPHDDDAPALTVWALLHRTYQPEGAPSLSGAVVTVSGESGDTVRLVEQDGIEPCLLPDTAEDFSSPGAACYRAERASAPFAPGEVLSLRIRAADGRVLTGASVVPGAFSLIGLTQVDGRCRLQPDTNYRFQWTPADDSWAYITDARLEGLAAAFASRGINAPDTLYLAGVSIGREDTDIVFPRNLGVFDFFDGDEDEREVIRALKNGLPEGSRAAVAITAVDRNWVNWARGGNFNPSGEVRIPSVFGEGTGMFGTATQRRVRIRSSLRGPGEPPLCGPVWN
ncbi:MAG: hypothetical protein OXU69_11695 [Gemmatimonadota bacterium]|nr:hypothetical protein [Gemmatimonadota bacterium]MDE2985358.1 hypothetical protein [Gemmatimonadota bacterium]